MTATSSDIRKVVKEVFPFKGESFRPNQEDAIVRIVESYLLEGKKFSILEGPTGTGKSVIAYTAIRAIQHFDNGHQLEIDKSSGETVMAKKYHGPYGLISVHTRALQTQYANSFSDAAVIWSGVNYPCALAPKDENMYWGCGECIQKLCPMVASCEYPNRLEDFMHAKVGITNYAYYLHAPFVRPYISVIDECHNLEHVLCDWATVELSMKSLTGMLVRLIKMKLLDIDFADKFQKIIRGIIGINDQRREWVDTLRRFTTEAFEMTAEIFSAVENELNVRKLNISDPRQLPPQERSVLQLLDRASRYFKRLAQKLKRISVLKTEWVLSNRIEEKNDQGKIYPRVDIKPLYIDEISHSSLFNQSKFFLFMSATICGEDIFRKYLGIPEESSTYISLPCSFPKENRPVYALTDIAKFVHSAREEVRPKFTRFIDKTVRTLFPNVRGIIHSVSYENAKFIQENAVERGRMRFPDSEDLLEIVKILKSSDNTIVVSPSVVEGLDLKDDLCRFAIFLKVPWVSLGDKWVKARADRDDAWYARDAVIKIVQGSGRGTRSASDSSITIILDMKFMDLWRRYKHFFPEWYRDAVEFQTSDGQTVFMG